MEGQHTDHSASHPGSFSGVGATPNVGDRGRLPAFSAGQPGEPRLAQDAAALRVDDQTRSSCLSWLRRWSRNMASRLRSQAWNR